MLNMTLFAQDGSHVAHIDDLGGTGLIYAHRVSNNRWLRSVNYNNDNNSLNMNYDSNWNNNNVNWDNVGVAPWFSSSMSWRTPVAECVTQRTL